LIESGNKLRFKETQMGNRLQRAGLLALFIAALAAPAAAESQTIQVPPGKPGELAYIPYPVTITVDGNTSEWAGIPAYTVDTGPYVSGDTTDNGQFVWSICADMRNIYIRMEMPDKKIIAGRHGQNFWNEDSFEFYFNLSGDLDAAAYGQGIVQANINATNIGKDDPTGLSLTGVRFIEEGYDVSGYAFKTDSGWGVELAMKLDNNLAPYHGFTIGMQFQANGATVKDRDSKLIWSIYDTGDNSWKNPKLFGTGVFYKLGSADIPEPSRKNLPKIVARKNQPLDKLPKVRVNQLGYLPKAAKWAAAVIDAAEPVDWELVDSNGKIAASGKTIPLGIDLSSNDPLHRIDFSAFKKEGTGYVLKAAGAESFPFDIAADLYHGLSKDAMRYFYLNRSGIALDESLAGEWAHGPWYASDAETRPFSGKDSFGVEWPERGYVLNASRGWFDAGDYGKYVVNGGISVWTLLNIYERNPSQFPDGSLGIPEAGNKIPDILDEARFEMDFMLGMQVPEGYDQAGMAHHKLHEPVWSPMPYRPAERTDDRFAFAPSTAATLNLAASAAQMARLIKPFDDAYSARCLAAAERAWKAAKENPEFKYGRIPGNGGGNYDDFNLEDEYYWAAAELFITTGSAVYKDEIAKALGSDKILAAPIGPNGPMYWGGVATLGHLSLALNGDAIGEAERATIGSLIINGADRYLGQIRDEGYLVPMFEYEWGSSSSVLNKMILMAYAYDATGTKEYLDGFAISMDYLLGRNALCKSFVAGYGKNPVHYPHHRFWADDPDSGYPPPPPGALSGGPNEKANDDATSFMVAKVARSKRYADDIRSFSTNEVAINWNAPLAWAASYLDEQYNPASGIKPAGKKTAFPAAGAIIGIIGALAAILLAAAAVVIKRKK